MRGFLLHARPFQEHGLLLDWLTDTHGWLRMRQPGARRVGSRGQKRPPAFVCLELQSAGRGGWPVLKSAEPVEHFRFLHGRRLAAAFYLHELILRALRPDEPVSGLFLDYWKSLAMLEEPGVPVSVVMRRFERQLLEHLGSGIDWGHTADRAPVDPDAGYRVGLQGGIVPDGRTGAIPGRVLLAIAADRPLVSAADRRTARDLMQALLVPHVGDRPFVSRRLWPSAPAEAETAPDSP
ncbi:MAG: DNA repair protein RecO [Guyparkeria sp.]|uniref:DNA repair protein RecO n=1 Tax=Guyparkeria sp. TaxID=2035736 RepID=UPI00397E4D23